MSDYMIGALVLLLVFVFFMVIFTLSLAIAANERDAPLPPDHVRCHGCGDIHHKDGLRKDGWFRSLSGPVYCEKHTPTWVARDDI